ncbi:MAG: hypothetical protein ACTSXH_13125 [Promethearchaeota archaeon]
MASKTNKNLVFPEFLTCDICGSTDIAKTREGYTCRNCGVVLNIPRLEYNRPYNETCLQHAPLNSTQIGTKHERLNHARSPHLQRLNKIHSISSISNEKFIIQTARKEISRLLEILGYSTLEMNQNILKKVKIIWQKIEKGTKFRNVEKLIPAVIYVYFKIKCLSINWAKLLENSKLSKEEFRGALMTVIRFLDHEARIAYLKRTRKRYCEQKILRIAEEFGLGMDFYHQAVALMYKLWDIIQNTKEDVIVGLACCLIALTSAYREKISVSKICTQLGIQMSTVQSQVKKRIIERFKIPGFTSLVKSANLIEKILKKLGILKEKLTHRRQKKVQGDEKQDIKRKSEISLEEEEDAIKIIKSFELDSIVSKNNKTKNALYILKSSDGNHGYLLLLDENDKKQGHFQRFKKRFQKKSSLVVNHQERIFSFPFKKVNAILKFKIGKGPPEEKDKIFTSFAIK